jgi:hypothetical protein
MIIPRILEYGKRTLHLTLGAVTAFEVAAQVGMREALTLMACAAGLNSRGAV